MKKGRLVFFRILAPALAFCFTSVASFSAQQPRAAKSAPSQSAAATSDPLLQAMREELDRSKSKLETDNVPAPYFIEYRLLTSTSMSPKRRFEDREDQRFHARSVRVVVRVGDYKQDSYFGPGVGAAAFAPLDDNPVALRWQLWAATDQAYKAASQALAMKKAALNQFTSSQPFDDFSKSAPLESIEPIAKLDFDPKPWKEILEKSSSLFRTDPKIESLITSLRFRSVNEYYVNTEGTITQSGHAGYFLNAVGSTQAADGMELERSPYYSAASLKELPTGEEFLAAVAKLVDTLKSLRDSPVVDEDYRGPVLFGPDAAADLFYGLVGQNVLGDRSKPGDSSRTTGEYASSYKGRVLPAFLSVLDDPTLKTFGGKIC